jgi:hypothetical protein
MKRVKKLLALALAGIMVLSCTIFASATSPATDYTGGTEQGQGVFESVLPDGRVRIVLPTFSSGVYNMILDPHSLIKQTGGSRYIGSGSTAPTFEGPSWDEEPTEDNPRVYLYFHNSQVNGVEPEFNYSSKSDTADVVNKSSFPVDLKVSVEVEKGLAGSSFDLVGKDEVATADGAAMYLGLEVVDVDSNTDTSSNTDTVTVATDAEGAEVDSTEIAVELAEDAAKVTAAPTVTVTGTSVGSGQTDADKLKAKEIISDINVVFNSGATAADKAEVIAALTKSRNESSSGAGDGVTAASIAIAYTKASAQVVLTTTIPATTVTNAAPNDTFIPVTYTADAATVSMKSAAGLAAQAFDPTNAEHLTDAYFSIPVKKTVNNATVTIAKIRGKVSAAKALVANDNAVAAAAFTESTAKVDPLSSASYSKELGAYDSAYANVFKATASGATTGEYVLAYYTETTVAYNNQQALDKLDELASTLKPAKGLRFNLVGAINPSGDWDKLDGAANNIDIAVIWDVSEAESRAKKPTLSVDAPITSSANSVVLNWTAGTGKYADYAPKIGTAGAKYTNSSGNSVNLATANNGTSTTSFKVNNVSSTVRVATNTNFVVVFTATGKDDIEVAFPSGWYS